MDIYLNGKQIEDRTSTFLGNGNVVLDLKDGSPVLRNLEEEIPISYFVDEKGISILPFLGEYPSEDGVYQILIERTDWGYFRASMIDPAGNNWSALFA